jgi:TP901 family phage tail tape measure protein
VSEVHRASSSLQQLQRELLASNKAISSSTKLANNLFRDTLTGSGQFSSHFVNLNSDVDKFGKNLDAGRLKLKNYFSTFREHATTQKGMIRELAKEQVMLQNSVLQPLGRNAQGLMQYNVMIPRGLDAVKNSTQLARMELQIMNRALSEGAGSLINWGKNTQWAGRQLTVGLTVPLTMFGAAASKAFREADQELVRLTKVYGDVAGATSAELKSIREEVIQTAKALSQTMGASFKDTIALGADIAATGKTGNDLLKAIEETTRLSILGEVDRQDAMKATLSIQTAFKQNTEELAESINFLNAVENQTSTTLNDLVEAIPKAGPVIKQLGGSIEDLALYMTAMREGGINASEGANALKSGLASLINPTKQTVGMMSDFGIDVMGMVANNTQNTTGLLTDLQTALNKLDPLSKARALEQMFGKFQFARMSALLNNLGKEGSQTLQVMELMKASTSDLAGVAERELGMITESASGKYRKAMEGLKATLAEVGEGFLGVATKIINAASKILDFFTDLPSPIKKALTFMAGFTALVGPLIMLTGVLANFFGYITKGIVQLRAFFMRASGWKMLTPEIIAAQKAAEMVENAFYSDAAAAQVLHNALQKLVLDYQNLQAASMKSAVPVNAGVSTVAGNAIVAPAHGRRVVDPNDPYVGDLNTRAMSHIRPRDPNNPATLFGGVPGAIPVNRGISRTPQIYMHDRLPNVEGLTSVKGISTGIVAPEAAKFHALMATLGMQTEQEVANLKKTIAMGGTVSRELLDTFDDILPITQRFADSAATQSALIVQQMRNAEITVDQAKARILALNAQIETDMGSAVSMYAAGRGRTIDLTRAPMMDQPVVDANGQFTLRDLYKKKTNAAVMEEFGRVRGVRTFGAPYSIQTTRMPKFNIGGDIESFGPNKTVVSGPSSVDYDDRLGSVPLGGYVLNQQAAMDPANAPLVAMAPSTYLNDGGNITAALTPREVVFGPQIQRMPELYAAVDAANSGYNFGGQIMNGISGYGKKTDKTPSSKMDERLFKKQYKEYLRFINNPRYEDDLRIRMIMLDAAELAGTAGMPVDEAIKKATSNFDKAKMMSGGSDEEFVKIRIKQVQNLEKKYPKLRVKKAKTAQSSTSNALNYKLNDVRDAMMDKNRFPNFVGVRDLVEAVSPTTFKNKDGMPIIQGLHERAHFRRRKDLGYMTSGYMGLAAVLPPGINNIMSRLEGIGLSRDVLNLNAADARENFELALKRTGMDKFTTVDDLYAAVQDDGKFKTKSEIESGRVVRATKEQKNSLRMFLEAAAKRQRWLPTRPPRLVMGGYNLGGMIPGGYISRGRSNYGNIAPALRLLAPDKQLKILAKARELSSRGSLGKFADMPVTEYGHQISASTGMSYPVPGVSGLYKVGNKKVFVKGVPNELTAVHEPIGTQIARDLFGIHSPVQTARTVANPVDPTKRTKLLALESDYDPRFANTNVPWDEDTVLRQLANSLLLNNKDLSRANVYGNFNPDVGQAGVLPKASGNTRLATADEMNSMEKQAMINLLAVKGGARKDFARDTAPIISKMSPKKYGRRMKKILEDARPKLLKIINDLPVDLRPPYQAMLKRLDDGIEVDWSQYHAVHANPKYLNAGGPVGGGPIKPGRRAYGRKDGSRRPGNPAARANWEAEQRAQRERDLLAERSRASSRQITGQQALTTGLGREAVRTGTTSFYNPGQVMVNNMIDPFRNSFMMKSRYLEAAFNMTANAATKGATTLAYGLMTSHKHIGKAYQEAAMSLMSTGKKASGMIRNGLDSINNFGRRVVDGGLRFRNAIVQEQNAYAAARYPAAQAPAQGIFGPGFVGRYKDTGVEGVQSRKVGTIGMRKTEYLVNGNSMNAAQAKASGINIPGRSGTMPMGAMMGIGMAGSMGGMALMQQEKVLGMSGMQAGMGLMVASSILPMLPFGRMAAGIKSAGSALKGLTTGLNKMARFGAMLGRFAKGFGLIGAAIAAAGLAFKLYKDYKDAQQDATMGLSMTAKAAEQAGIKHFDLNAEMKATIENRKLLSAAGKGGEGLSVGLPGIAMSVKEMKTAKEEGKKLKDFIESLNRSKGFDETLRLVSNQKAQFIAAGMSVEDANKKIYGALANSERSGDTFKLLADKTFAGISDKATAATFAVGNLINTLNKGPGSVDFAKEVGEGFEGLINIFDLTTKSLVGTKDAFGNVIDQFDAYKQVMTDFGKVYGDSLRKPIGEEAYNDLARSNMLLGEITTKADTVEGILAKWTLFSSGFAADLSKIDSDLAVKLASFTTSIQSGITDLADAGGVATTFATVETAMDRLRATINKNSAASQRAANAAQRNSQEELKAIAKKIKLIDEEKNKKLEALRATQDASNYALQLQKLQIEYADAVSRGDMAAANQAKLDIDQLTLNRQTDLAQKAIEDAANKAKAPLEKDAQKIQDAADKRSTGAAIAADNASAAQEIAATLEKYQKQYSDLTVEAINVKLLPPEQQAAAQKEVDRKIFALIKEVQRSGTGNSLLAKTVRDGFGKYFDENGKALKLQQTSVEYNGSTLTEVKTVNKKILDIFTADANSALKQAELITGKVTLKQLRDDVVAALLRYRPNTPEGTAKNEVNQPGTAKDYSAQKTLGSAGAVAAKPPTLGGSAEKYTRVNNDGMEETFTVFTYKNKSYVVDSGGNIYKYDYSAQTVIDLDKKPVGKARAMGGPVRHFEPGGKVAGPGTATSDSIPAMLSDGEYVFSAKAVDAAGGADVVDGWHKALRRADGGPILTSPRQKKPGVPYSRSGSPIGNPFGQYWGELSRFIGPRSPGMDIWGGTEIPGLKFTGKVPQHSDYMHQMLEQPRKPFTSPGMGLDKDPMRFAGSGASMGGIGSGAYGLGPLMFANGGLVQGFKFGGFADKFKNLMKFGAKGGIKGFGMGAKSGAAYQAMEETEKFLSLKYGANENASGLEKWGKSVARFGWSALQGGVTGAASGGGLGFVGGALAGTVEGLIGLIKGGSQFGVKGGKAYDEEKLWKRGDLNGLNDKYFNSDYAPDINKIAKKDLANMSLTSSLKNVATTAGLSAILPYSSMLLRTAADKTAVARQGVRVFDKRLPKFVNDLMELNFVKPTKYLDRVNKTLSEYQEKARATAGEIPEILAGKGVVNLYGPRRYASAMMDDIPTPRELYEFGPKGQLSNMFNAIKDKATAFLYPADRGINYSAQVRLNDNNVRMPIHRSESSPASTIRALLSLYGGKASDIGLIQRRQGTIHSGSPDTLFHELGHRNLNILGGPEAIANRSMSARNWHGTHEGFADIFQDDAQRLLQGSQNAKLTDRLGSGNTYSTTSGNTILEDMVWRLSGGLGKNRLHQMGTEFLVPYTNMIKNRVPADTLKRLQDMARIEGPNLESKESVKSLYDMITQNIPKFEYGINSVPADMLALIHKNEAVIPANMNPFNPNATAAASGSVYNINVELNGTNVTAKDVALEIRNEMRLKEMAAGVNRKVGP